MNKQLLGWGVLCAALATGPGIARADLIAAPQILQTGTGLGNVNTVLTIQSPGNSTVASGCIGFNGAATPAQVTANCQSTSGAESYTDSTVKNGASQTSLVTVGSTGASTASQLAIVYNSNQPAGGAVTLTSLTMTIYSTSGKALFSASTTGPTSIPSTLTGTGKSGFPFVLTGSQASTAQAFWSAANLIGLGAQVNGGVGGPETFYTASVPGTTPGPGTVPEPSSVLLVLGGIAGLIFQQRRRNA